MNGPHLLRRFWEEHDRTLLEEAEATISLRHDLYRGLPASLNGFFDALQRWTVKSLVRGSPPRPGERILDLGCGTGRWSRFFAAFGACPVGVDLGVRALRWAKRLLPEGGWAVMAIPRLGFQDGSFDWAISVTVLQHLPYPEQEEAVREIHRLLRPGGRGILVELVDISEHVFYVFPRAREDWEALFGRAGFRIRKFSACERIPWVPILRKAAGVVRARGLESGWDGKVPWGAAVLRRCRWLRWGVPAFLALAYPAERMAAWLKISRWARYGGWLLQKEGPCGS
mgnify:FL=1